MDGLGARAAGRVEDPRHVEIALARGAGPMATASSASATCGQSRVGLGVHRDGADAEGPAAADHPAGDLPPVGDQDAAEHGGQAGGAAEADRVDGAARQPAPSGAQRVRRVTAPLPRRAASSRSLTKRLSPILANATTGGSRRERRRAAPPAIRAQLLGREPARRPPPCHPRSARRRSPRAPAERLGHRPACRRLLEPDELLRIVAERRGGRGARLTRRGRRPR